MKRILFLAGSLLPLLSAKGQQYSNTAIPIGGHAPSGMIDNIINYRHPSLRLADFKGKLLILDFFTTNCSSCIANLPKLDSLQRQFSDSLQILAVTPEKASIVNKFFSNTRTPARPKIATIAEDSLLTRAFPHAAIPHIVWISPEGIVDAFTFAEYVNTHNIRAALRGEAGLFPEKNDNVRYNYNAPLLKPVAAVSDDSPLYYSTLTGFAAGLFMTGGIHMDSVNMVMRRYAINHSIVDLYLMAMGRLINFPRNRIVLEVKTPEAYIYTPTQGYFQEWQQQNSRCYELRCSIKTSKEQMQQFMIQDLNRFTHANGRLERRLVKCYILKKDPQLSKLHTTGGPPEIKSSPDGAIHYIHNTTFAALLYKLNDMRGLPPIIDGTNYQKNVDLILNMPYADLPALRSSLNAYGLSLEESQLEMDLLIITEITAS